MNEELRDPYEVFLELVDKVENPGGEEIEELESRISELEERVSQVAQYAGRGVNVLVKDLRNIDQRLQELERSEEVELVPEDVDETVAEESGEEGQGHSVEELKEAAADVIQEAAEDSDGDEEEEFECPQCGEYTDDTVKGLAAHTNNSGDHANIGDFFQTRDGVYECPLCGTPSSNSSALGVHLNQVHDSNLTEVYLDRFDDLKQGYVDGPYNFEGNIPDLHQTKYIKDYSVAEVQSIVEEFLVASGEALSLQRIADLKFGEELETSSAEYQKLSQAVNGSELIDSRDNPYDARKQVYFFDGGDGQ